MQHNYIFITGLCGERFLWLLSIQIPPPPRMFGHFNWIQRLIMMQIVAIVVDLIVIWHCERKFATEKRFIGEWLAIDHELHESISELSLASLEKLQIEREKLQNELLNCKLGIRNCKISHRNCKISQESVEKASEIQKESHQWRQSGKNNEWASKTNNDSLRGLSFTTAFFFSSSTNTRARCKSETCTKASHFMRLFLAPLTFNSIRLVDRKSTRTRKVKKTESYRKERIDTSHSWILISF